MSNCSYLNFCWTLIAAALAQLILISCGLDIEDSTAPSPPAWIDKSLPEEWPERGIDAHEGGGIILEWSLPRDDDVGTYDIFRSISIPPDSLHDLEFELIASIPVGNGTQYYHDKGAERNKGYFYYMIAEDVSSNQSESSDTLYYYSMLPVKYSTMLPTSTTDTLRYPFRLHWIYPVEIEMETYILTILINGGDVTLRTTLVPESYTSDMEYYTIEPEQELAGSGIYSWRVDCNARYQQGVETYGSESRWANFSYIEDE